MFSTGGSSEEEREQRDFILRLVRQIIRGLADMARGRDRERLEQALAEVEEAYRSLDVDPSLLHLLGDEPMIGLFAERGQLESLGLLVWAEAKIRMEQGETALAERFKRRSRTFLQAAQSKGVGLSLESQAILEGDFWQ